MQTNSISAFAQPNNFHLQNDSKHHIPISNWRFAWSFRPLFESGWFFTSWLMLWRGFVARKALSWLRSCRIFVGHWSESFHLRTSEWWCGTCTCWSAASDWQTFWSTYKSGICTLTASTLCLKKVPTFKLFVTLSKLNRFSKFLHFCENLLQKPHNITHLTLGMLLHYLGI